MNLTIKNQESYSRVELLLRTFFGWLYMALPHGFLLMFVGIWAAILKFIAFWAVLFTGRYPQSMFEFHAGYLYWGLRLNARMMNLSDGYPPFGINAKDDYVTLEIPYPEKLSRGLLLLRTFFGFIYVLIPHGIILLFRTLVSFIVAFIAWWIVLFTGKYPDSLHNFVTGLYRWNTRLNVYMGFMSDKYPPFTGKPDAQ